MELELLMPVAVFAGVALGIFALYHRVREPRLLRERIQRYEAKAADSGAPQAASILLRDRRFSAISWLHQLLQKSHFAEKMALDLAQAGIPMRVGEYILVRWLCAAVLALPFFLRNEIWLLGLVAGIIGFYIPHFFLRYQRQRRLKKTVNQLIDAIGLISNSLRSGYSFSQGLDLVSKELSPPIAEEFQQVLAELNLGNSIEEALTQLVKRVPSYDFDLLATAVIIQRQVGGNLAEVLDNIAHTIRERIRILGEVHTRTSQARFSGYVVGLMPFFLMGVISIMNPRYLRELFSTPLGLFLLGAALFMEVIGFLVMRRIVDIEV
ncbi:MAG: type II secretion system F family protein [Chloroflexi bacterium]|nr:type II secretion system F family protein [Chloroflexota bacterium]